jgi:flagellar hook-length control protein FliK
MESTRVAPTQSSQSTQQAPQAAGQAQRGKGGGHSQGVGTTANPGDFLALLAGLNQPLGELDAPLDPAGARPASDALLPEVDPHGADAATLAAWQGLLVPQDTVTPALGMGARGGEAGLAGSQAYFNKGAGYAQGVVAETAVLDAAADLRGGVAPSAGSGYGRAFTRLNTVLAQRPDAAESLPSRISLAVGAADRLPGLTSGMQAAQAFLQTQVPVGAPPFAGPDRTAGGEASADAQAGLADLLTSVGQAQERSAGASAGDPGGRDSGGGAGGIADFDGVSGTVEPFDAALGAGDVIQSSAEDQIAEQVAYWVNQETQNAELTITRDGQPVEVSVSLSGNEAHVTFRSDQEQTRELLDRSMLQLSELLRGEGLVLSGMSVGSSAGRSGGGNGSDQRRQREDARQAQVSVATPVGASVAGGGRVSDRSVDVFV